jgi:hypothetical protein
MLATSPPPAPAVDNPMHAAARWSVTELERGGGERSDHGQVGRLSKLSGFFIDLYYGVVR